MATFIRIRTVNVEWILEERATDLYIPPYARAFGLLLSVVALAFFLTSAIFVCRRHDTTEIRLGQPVFLHTACFGASCIAISIVFVSFDDSRIENLLVLDNFCLIVMWLSNCGLAIIYMGKSLCETLALEV